MSWLANAEGYFTTAVLLLFLFTVSAHGAPSAGVRVTLPDNGAYAYWVQSKAGTIAPAMPVTVSGHSQITLPGGTGSGDTLYVLDKHDGAVAAKLLSASPLALTVSDFKPLTPAASAAPVAATAAAPPEPAPEQPSGIARLFTIFIGLLVAGGVFWVIRHLILSRGQPLILAARRLGVDVPDPEEKPLDVEAAPVYTPTAPRPVEKIPEEAGVMPPPAAPIRRTGFAETSESPQIVGVQGLAAGTTFAIPVGDVLIGRDGDNGLVLAESTVSRRHARLSRDGAGRITLADEGSANGIYVNGQRVTDAVLAPGDQIQIGDNYFRLEA